MALAFEHFLQPGTAQPRLPRIDGTDYALEVAVVFTSAAATIAALRAAGGLAGRLNARISLLVMQVVPFPLPLESPPVLPGFSENRFKDIASESPVETRVRIFLCRDASATLKAALAPRSIVAIGGRRRWWPTREKALAGELRHAGHEVIFTETE
jgi:hypothetical protein